MRHTQLDAALLLDLLHDFIVGLFVGVHVGNHADTHRLLGFFGSLLLTAATGKQAPRQYARDHQP